MENKMRDRTNKQLAEKLDIIKESFNENGSVFELLTIVQERLISIPIEPPVMQKIAKDIEIMKNAQLKTIDDYIKDIEDKTIVEVNKKIRDIVGIAYDSVIKYVSNFSA